MNPAESAKDNEKTVFKVAYKKGERIKVKEGPFTNFDGVVDDIKAEKRKLKVLVSIFGRETPVELGFDQVEKIH